jgi:ribosomal protein L37AE/L43A
MFMRKRGVSSLAPEGMRDLKCPNCGAAGNFTDAGKCEYCDTFIQAGEMQWAVNQMTVIHQEVFSTKGLAHYEQEVGTDYPTIVQPAINTYINRFTELHKLPDWNTYWNNFTDNIAVAYFNEIYAAWSSLKWEKVRHLVSDRLYESYGFWIEAYKKENLQNKLDNISISRIDMAAIEVDKYYESFTVRIFASCLDYVENSKGKVLGGSKKSPRYFSEYWTFMRRAGVEIVESEFSLNNCPNCGAAADKMGQTAVCEYCGTKISNGDFSWILTRIVQDEEYTG